MLSDSTSRLEKSRPELSALNSSKTLLSVVSVPFTSSFPLSSQADIQTAIMAKY